MLAIVAVGCAVAAFDNPAAGFQEYVFPAIEGVPICIDGTVQDIELSAPAFAVGRTGWE